MNGQILRPGLSRDQTLKTATELDKSNHIESHVSLLSQPTLQNISPRGLDGIVVPTIRPKSLGPASRLAQELGCPLIALCSTPDQVIDARRKMGPSATGMLATYVPENESRALGKLLSFLTPRHPENDIVPSCHNDIARKRNIGLLLARLSGWQTVMFLDDDIRGLTAKGVLQATALTRAFRAVGFTIGKYPDNSVVCHAHRLSGADQRTFPGGSALILDVARCDTPFPAIYNEDWLFLYDTIMSQSLATAGQLRQLPYKPFERAQRAASEEFGDVIAEALFRLIHEGRDVTDATADFWAFSLERRSRLIEDIANRLLLREENLQLIGAALMSLTAARKRLAAISPLACLSFVRAWRADVDTWRGRLGGLPLLGSLAEAAKYLGLAAMRGGR